MKGGKREGAGRPRLDCEMVTVGVRVRAEYAEDVKKLVKQIKDGNYVIFNSGVPLVYNRGV